MSRESPVSTGKGLFVTFEGIEGSGKTTQLNLLAGRLEAEGWPVVKVREPGGTDLGEALRALLLADGSEPIDARAELCMYLAARAQLTKQVITPALAGGRIVLADRFGDASIAYQGRGRRLGMRAVRSLVRFAAGELVPHRTYLLDLEPEVGLPRVARRGRPDRFESEDIAFHRRVRAGYRAIARAEPSRVRSLRGDDEIDAIALQIWDDMRPLLEHTRPR